MWTELPLRLPPQTPRPYPRLPTDRSGLLQPIHYKEDAVEISLPEGHYVSHFFAEAASHRGRLGIRISGDPWQRSLLGTGDRAAWANNKNEQIIRRTGHVIAHGDDDAVGK